MTKVHDYIIVFYSILLTWCQFDSIRFLYSLHQIAVLTVVKLVIHDKSVKSLIPLIGLLSVQTEIRILYCILIFQNNTCLKIHILL